MNLAPAGFFVVAVFLCVGACSGISNKGLLLSEKRVDVRYLLNDVSQAWATNSNTTIYRHHGIFSWGDYQYAAFFLDASILRVIRREISKNNIEQFDIKGVYPVTDTHNAISIGIDSLGHLHLSYAQHANPLRYRRGYAEPVIDRLRWQRDEILSMFIQKSGPPSGKQRQEQYEPAYIIDWDLVRNWN